MRNVITHGFASRGFGRGQRNAGAGGDSALRCKAPQHTLSGLAREGRQARDTQDSANFGLASANDAAAAGKLTWTSEDNVICFARTL